MRKADDNMRTGNDATKNEAPHRPAAFINAIAEEGTKAEAIEWLQKTWNELCQAESELRKLKADMERAARNHAADLTFAQSATTDSKRLDWLERHHVEVRDPLLYGSRHMFLATPVRVEGMEDEPSNLRDMIDGLMSVASTKSDHGQ